MIQKGAPTLSSQILAVGAANPCTEHLIPQGFNYQSSLPFSYLFAPLPALVLWAHYLGNCKAQVT